MRRRGVVLLGLLVPCVLSCAGLPGMRLGQSADSRAFDAALRGAEESPAIGRGRLAAFLRSHPGSPLFDDAALELARLERADGNPAAAERPLRDALVRQPRGDRVDAVRLELAELARGRGDDDVAWQEAQRVRIGLLRVDEKPRAARLIADLARDRGERAIEVEALAQLRDTAPPAETVAIDAELARALSEVPTDALLRIVERLGSRTSAGVLWLAIGERALREGDRSLAVRAFARADRGLQHEADIAHRDPVGEALDGRPSLDASLAIPPPLGELASGFSPPDTRALSGAIGVALPLSGPFAEIAEQTLRGVLLATGVFASGAAGDAAPGDPNAPGGGLRVLVRDTGGTPDGAAAAVRALAAQPEVRAVIGPMLTEEVQAAADAAAEAGLPLLTLTRHESVADAGAGVFRLSLTRAMEAEILADHAVRELGLRRVAILYPQDDYGREFEELLWQAVEARGARVVGVAGYTPGAGDFTAPIRQLVGWTLLDDTQRARLAQRDAERAAAAAAGIADTETAGSPANDRAAVPAAGRGFEWSDPDADALPPVVDFDALFVPDAPDLLAGLAQQLASEGVEGVVLFGPSAWYHADMLRRGGTRMEGTFFTSSFDPSHPAPMVQEFVSRYESSFGEDASVFAAQGFDAANLVTLQLARGAHDRVAVRDSLLSMGLYPGVSGPMAFESDGNARKRPFLVGIRSGQLVSIE
jgi:ABC-type branched-subunit amino acid transport system substrate-binding protein